MAEKTRTDGTAKSGARKDGPQTLPGTDNSSGRGGYSHADTRIGHRHSETLADLERAVTGSTAPPRKNEGSASDADAMSRGEERGEPDRQKSKRDRD